MFHHQIEPRFSDTDGLGHISNTAFPTWFEHARMPIFRIFHPSLELASWPLIVARVAIDYKAQCYWGEPVAIQTGIGHVGTSSVQIIQTAHQDGVEVARSEAVLIHFDYASGQSAPIPDPIRAQLEANLVAGD
ncbi:acyl-CoA thioesterase [Halomonadaceae bacterium KBTZ08]